MISATADSISVRDRPKEAKRRSGEARLREVGRPFGPSLSSKVKPGSSMVDICRTYGGSVVNICIIYGESMDNLCIWLLVSIPLKK